MKCCISKCKQLELVLAAAFSISSFYGRCLSQNRQQCIVLTDVMLHVNVLLLSGCVQEITSLINATSCKHHEYNTPALQITLQSDDNSYLHVELSGTKLPNTSIKSNIVHLH